MKNFILAVSILFNILFLVRYFVLRAQEKEKEPAPQMIADIEPAEGENTVSERDHICELILRDERERLPITIQGIDFVSNITIDSVRLIGNGSEGVLYTTWTTVQPNKTLPVVVELKFIDYSNWGDKENLSYKAQWSSAESEIFSRRLGDKYGR